jgi:hypothetical protein
VIDTLGVLAAGVALAGLACFGLALLLPDTVWERKVDRPTLLGLGLAFAILGFGVSAVVGGL